MDLAPHVHDAERLGRAIFEQDLASSRASERVLKAMDRELDERIVGWITRRKGDRWLVQFIGAEGSSYVALWEAEVNAFGATVTARPLEPAQPLDSEGNAMARARATAVAHPFRPCSKRYNTVVLPASLVAQSGYLVYLLASTEDEDWIVGGHQRFLVSADGQKVVSHQPLSRGCLAVPASPSKGTHGAWVTHIVGDAPAETHVFLSLMHQAPLFVGTRRGVWKVAGEKISYQGEPL